MKTRQRRFSLASRSGVSKLRTRWRGIEWESLDLQRTVLAAIFFSLLILERFVLCVGPDYVTVREFAQD